MSVVHVSPSLQVEVVTHAGVALHVPQPATLPSVQRVPTARGLHAVVLVPGMHTSHWLAGLMAPLA